METDANGNIYTTGTFSGTVDFDPSTAVFNLTATSGSDNYIQKLDANGNFIWARAIGGINNDKSYDIHIDPMGNVYNTGHFNGTVDFDPSIAVFNLTSVGAGDIYIYKLNALGDFVWAKSMGQLGSDWGTSIVSDATGNAYIVGSFQGTVDFDPSTGVQNLTSAGDYDSFFLKLTANRNFVWAKRMGNTSNDVINTLEIDALGNLYTTGYFVGTMDVDPGTGVQNLTSVGTNSETYIQKLDNNGDLIWAKRLAASNAYNRPQGLCLDATGNVYTVGTFAGTMDVDPSATTLYLTPQGSSDAFIHKLDPNGNFVWAKKMGQVGYSESRAIDVDAQGNIYTTGIFNNTINLDPSPTNTDSITTNGNFDLLIQQLDSTGNFVWGTTIGGTDADYATAIHVDNNDDIHLIGQFKDTIQVNLASGTTTLASQGREDVFILKLKSGITTNMTTLAPINSLQLFPNPAQQHLYLQGLEGNFQGSILDATGRFIQSFNSTTLSVEDLAPGIYYLQLKTEQQQYVGRFIKS